MHRAHRFDAVALIFGQNRLDLGRVDAMAPIAFHQGHVEPQAASHVLPQHGEMAGLEHQHPVARHQYIDQGRFPSAGPRGRVDDHRLLSLEHPAHIAQHRGRHASETGAAMVVGRRGNGAQNPPRNITRSRNL